MFPASPCTSTPALSSRHVVRLGQCCTVFPCTASGWELGAHGCSWHGFCLNWLHAGDSGSSRSRAGVGQTWCWGQAGATAAFMWHSPKRHMGTTQCPHPDQALDWQSLDNLWLLGLFPCTPLPPPAGRTLAFWEPGSMACEGLQRQSSAQLALLGRSLTRSLARPCLGVYRGGWGSRLG